MRFGHGANLPDGDLRSEFLKNGVQSGLSGGTQNSGSAVVPDQLGNRPDTGSQIGEGEHLGLVKDQDALGQVVELPAFGRLAGIKGFKELDCCGDDYRNIPRLHRSAERPPDWMHRPPAGRTAHRSEIPEHFHHPKSPERPGQSAR